MHLWSSEAAPHPVICRRRGHGPRMTRLCAAALPSRLRSDAAARALSPTSSVFLLHFVPAQTFTMAVSTHHCIFRTAACRLLHPAPACAMLQRQRRAKCPSPGWVNVCLARNPGIRSQITGCSHVKIDAAVPQARQLSGAWTRWRSTSTSPLQAACRRTRRTSSPPCTTWRPLRYRCPLPGCGGAPLHACISGSGASIVAVLPHLACWLPPLLLPAVCDHQAASLMMAQPAIVTLNPFFVFCCRRIPLRWQRSQSTAAHMSPPCPGTLLQPPQSPRRSTACS